MRLFAYTVAAVLTASVLLLGFGPSVLAEAKDYEIVVSPGSKAFEPQEIRIKMGERVTWVNRGEEEHFLTSAGPSSMQVVLGTNDLMIHELLQPGKSYAYTFDAAETYYYFCAIHNEMWGTVIVEE